MQRIDKAKNTGFKELTDQKSFTHTFTKKIGHITNILHTQKKERIESLENEAKKTECEKQKYNLTFGTSPHPRTLESPRPHPNPRENRDSFSNNVFISKFIKIVHPLRGKFSADFIR